MPLTNSPKKPFHVAICGGGIGGLCTAIGLLHQNISFTLYESAPAFAEIGAGVSFGPNATQAMALIDPEIRAGYDRIATLNAWPDKKKTFFEYSLGQREDGWEDLKAPGKEGQKIAEVIARDVASSSVHRARFLEVLVKLIPDGVARFRKRVEAVERRGEKMVLRFQDGESEEADAVIGCDGVKSRTRGILLGDDHEATNPTFTGKYAYRALVPMEKAVEAVGDELARNGQIYLGRHGHVLTFPIEKGATLNMVAFKTKMDGQWENKEWVLPMKKEDMLKDFAGWGKSVQNILSLVEKADLWALFDHPPAPTYYKGRFALLGDAAHASTPHQGAGAGQAIEDAFVITNLLGQARSIDDVESAFHAYDAVRRPRTQKVVSTSRHTAIIYEFEKEELGTDLEKIKEALETRFFWIWEEDLPQQLKRAQEIMAHKVEASEK